MGTHPSPVFRTQNVTFMLLRKVLLLFLGTIASSRVAEVIRRHKGPSPKSLDLDLGPIKTLPKVQQTQGIEYKSTLTH